MLSGHQQFPDGFYEFQNSGRMTWAVDSRFVPTGFRAGRLRNLGLLLPPTANRPQFGRILASRKYHVRVDRRTLAAEQLTPVPALTFQISRQQVTASAVFNLPVTQVTWNFGDEAAWQTGNASAVTPPTYSLQHTYRKAGPYVVTLRAVTGGQLYEYTARVAVSPDFDVAPPLTPAFAFTPLPPAQQPPPPSIFVRYHVDATLPAGVQANVLVVVGNRTYRGTNGCDIQLAKGAEADVICSVALDLKVDFSSGQCFDPAAQALTLSSLRAATNRQFDDQGALQNTTLNACGTRVFGNGEHTPLDVWQAAITILANPSLKSVDEWGREIVDVSELADAILALEYEAENL